jgi:hypothetical protein
MPNIPYQMFDSLFTSFVFLKKKPIGISWSEEVLGLKIK